MPFKIGVNKSTWTVVCLLPKVCIFSPSKFDAVSDQGMNKKQTNGQDYQSRTPLKIAVNKILDYQVKLPFVSQTLNGLHTLPWGTPLKMGVDRSTWITGQACFEATTSSPSRERTFCQKQWDLKHFPEVMLLQSAVDILYCPVSQKLKTSVPLHI